MSHHSTLHYEQQIMDTFNIVTVIAIILFARLGMRLLFKYNKTRKDEENTEEK